MLIMPFSLFSSMEVLREQKTAIHQLLLLYVQYFYLNNIILIALVN
jgi:hypothetical protein